MTLPAARRPAPRSRPAGRRSRATATTVAPAPASPSATPAAEPPAAARDDGDAALLVSHRRVPVQVAGSMWNTSRTVVESDDAVVPEGHERAHQLAPAFVGRGVPEPVPGCPRPRPRSRGTAPGRSRRWSCCGCPPARARDQLRPDLSWCRRYCARPPGFRRIVNANGSWLDLLRATRDRRPGRGSDGSRAFGSHVHPSFAGLPPGAGPSRATVRLETILAVGTLSSRNQSGAGPGTPVRPIHRLAHMFTSPSWYSEPRLRHRRIADGPAGRYGTSTLRRTRPATRSSSASFASASGRTRSTRC